ncbi:hypothetical protein [Thiolapillus sp.]
MKRMKYTHARALINKISTWTTELKAGQLERKASEKVEAAQINGEVAM